MTQFKPRPGFTLEKRTAEIMTSHDCCEISSPLMPHRWMVDVWIDLRPLGEDIVTISPYDKIQAIADKRIAMSTR